MARTSRRSIGLVCCVFALEVACTTYVASGLRPGADGGARDSGGGTVAVDGAGSTSGFDSTSGTSSGGATEGGPGPTLPACPACSGASCIASGCSGSPPATCTAPFDVTSATTLTAILCPDAERANLPTPCAGGGMFPVAMVRLGANGSKWTISAQGTSPFVAGGGCNDVTACNGGSSSASTQADAFTTVMIGTTAALTACQEFQITITK